MSFKKLTKFVVQFSTLIEINVIGFDPTSLNYLKVIHNSEIVI